MAKEDNLIAAEQGATETGLTLSGFRAKVKQFGIRGLRQGKRLYYSQGQLDDVARAISMEKKEAEKLRQKGNVTMAKDKLADYKKQSADHFARRLKKT